VEGKWRVSTCAVQQKWRNEEVEDRILIASSGTARENDTVLILLI
jgi:hypothetical protein